MSDPRNDAHDKKVAHQKHDKNDKTEKSEKAEQEPAQADAGTAAVTEILTPAPPSAALEGSLAVLAKLKDLEFHSRAHLERLAELALTVEDELKQKDFIGPLGEVYSAQSAVQTTLTALLEAYKAECDRLAG